MAHWWPLDDIDRDYDAGGDNPATLGHTGRQVAARIPTQIYGAAIVAALSRICAAMEPWATTYFFIWRRPRVPRHSFDFFFGRLLLADRK